MVMYVREFFGRKFNIVSLKFEGIWRTEQWVSASGLELSEGPVEHPRPTGFERTMA